MAAKRCRPKSSSMGENVHALHDQWMLLRALLRGIVAKRPSIAYAPPLQCNNRIPYDAASQRVEALNQRRPIH